LCEAYPGLMDVEPRALRGSTGLHFFAIHSGPSKLRGEQLNGSSFLPNRNVVFVVDDDPGMLMSVKRLLRANDYDSVLFPSAEAFANRSDFDGAVCVLLDINLGDGSGIELKAPAQNDGEYCASYLHDRERYARRSRGRASIRLSRLSHKAVLGEVADRAAKEPQ